MRTIRCPAGIWRANARSRLSPAGRGRAAVLVTLNLAAAAIYFVYIGHGIGLGGYRIDLDVYRTGARVWLHGGDLYGRLPRLGGGHQLPFTYPPFAALAFVPLAIVSDGAAKCLLAAVTIASVAASLWCYAAHTAAGPGARMRRLLPWAPPAAAAARTRPFHLDLRPDQRGAHGPGRLRLPDPGASMAAGIGVGIAAALKLTPGIFLLFFLLRRDLRSAAPAGLSFAVCTGLGFALAPHDSVRYWTKIAYQPNRMGGISYASNQSLLGTLARLGLGDPARAWLWLALSVLVAGLAVTGMRGALKTNQVTAALSLNAAAGLLISPISWSHHWVGAAPALLTCLTATNPNRRRPPTFAILALLTFAIAPHWLLPSAAATNCTGHGRSRPWATPTP